ncbi:Murein DD-endopeptidase MepM and murein hydrolase activator NlpD, contain LysM domain [Fontimonas thermophila]|uniref:Murein DD-endopeptidase MepM and murein hydrolase activator NlpD, contain LysM domain n=2 Tax=Fontimonas thermophila TaxID=1076937 RepID=A0A1I2IGK8_9GAMM|nr:Murein DD-endopeptidase MepM and murein hydrolase activator NlpD, contain LysM domain [Fontimonas thermophila]
MKMGLPAVWAGFWFVSVAMGCAAADAGIPGVAIDGEWRQGSVLFGQAPPGSRVWFNGRALRLTADGRFVFGLHRDEPPTAELKVQLPDEPAPRTFQAEVARRAYSIQRIDGLPPKMVTPPPEVQRRIAAEQALVARVRERDSALTGFTERFIWPCLGPVSGVFGSQRILNGEPKQPHYGVDVAVPTGTPVRAPASGVVSLAHPDMYYTGGTLMIDHGHGLQSAFLHLSKLLVKEGDAVRQGQVIAESGATGRATGAHLDWRVNWFDARVDPQSLVPPMDQAFAEQRR